MLAWVLVTIAVIVLAPFRFGGLDLSRLSLLGPGGDWPADLALNVVLFLPVGFLLHRLGAGQVAPGLVAGGCLLLSFGIEACQLFLPDRWPTGTDLFANFLGGWLGALASRSLRATLGEGTQLLGRTLLDLPLTGLVYVMVPWLWLIAVGSDDSAVRTWAMVPLGIAGGVALAGAARSAAPQDGRMGRYLSRITLAWAMIVTAPAIRFGLPLVAATVVASVGAAWLFKAPWRSAPRQDRRIEPQVLQLVAPLVIIALLGVPYDPGAMALDSMGDTRLEMVRWLERVAGYLVLGYIIAEWRGRLEESLPRGLLVPAIGASLLVAGELAIGSSTSLVGAGLAAIVPACAGASLYHLSRLHVRYLLGRPATTG